MSTESSMCQLEGRVVDSSESAFQKMSRMIAYHHGLGLYGLDETCKLLAFELVMKAVQT